MSDSTEQIFQEFKQEASELINGAIDILIQCEKNDDAFKTESMATLFRHLHSLKGGLGMFQYELEVKYVHEAESILNQKIQSKKPLSCAEIQLIIEALDKVENALCLKNGILSEDLVAENSLIMIENEHVCGPACCGEKKDKLEEIIKEVHPVVLVGFFDKSSPLLKYLQHKNIAYSHFELCEEIYFLSSKIKSIRVVFVSDRQRKVDPLLFINIINLVFPESKVVLNLCSPLEDAKLPMDSHFLCLGEKNKRFQDILKTIILKH